MQKSNTKIQIFFKYITLKICIISFFLSTSFFLYSTLSHADEPSPKTPVVVNGDKVEYFHEQKRVIGSGSISVTYQDVVLTCDKITVYLDTREAIAEGNVKITQGDSYFTGEKINYNFDTKLGTAVKGYVNSAPFYGKAEEIDKVADKQVNLKHGYVTTCDLEKPHYRVEARQVRIYFDDKVVAKDIVFYLWDTPIFYLPYYIQPLKERTSHITILTGKDDEWGYFGLSSIRYYFSEMAKGRFRLDYRHKKGLAEGVDYYFTTKEFGSGSAKFYYTRENDWTVIRAPGDEKVPERTRWRTQARHKWDITDDTTSILEFNSFSDIDFARDYIFKELEELPDPQDHTYLSIITTKDDYTMSLLLRKRYDKFYTVVERIPELAIDIKSYKIGELPVYYQGNITGVYLNKATAGSTEKDLNIARVDLFNRFTYTERLFRFWSISPYAGNRQTYFSRNRWGDTNVLRNIFNFGIDNSTKFYRIFDVTSNFLGMEINKLRHIITPSANYYYTHQPSISPNNLIEFDGIDTMNKNNGIAFAIENKLQTKRRLGKNEQLSSVDLATLLVSTNYDFTFKKDLGGLERQKFQNINILFELQPYPWLFVQTRGTVNTKRQTVEHFDIDIAGEGKDKWSLDLGYRYEDVKSGQMGALIGDLYYRVNPKWDVRIYERFNIYGSKRKVQEQEYTIIRDLHCWLLEVTYNIKGPFDDPDNKTIWIALRLKAFPETPLGFKKSYPRPTPGATVASSNWANRWPAFSGS